MDLKGGCLCGSVRFEANTEPMSAGHCHCKRCQHMSGGGSVTGVMVPQAAVKVVARDDSLATFAQEGHTTRQFCRHCGSSVMGIHGEMAILSAGGLDDGTDIQPQFHMMVAYRAPWDVIDDGLPQFDEFPPMGSD